MRVVVLLLAMLTVVVPARPEDRGIERNILVTAKVRSSKDRERFQDFQPSDFVVKEKEITQKITAVKPGADLPITLGLFIQDDLINQVNTELKGLKKFITELPKGSRVMVGYITAGGLSLETKDGFTTDLQAAAKSLRVLRGAPAGTPFNPYVPLIEGLKRFEQHSNERKIAIVISDGIDLARGLDQAAPGLSVDLDRAIKEAQWREVVVYALYAPSATAARFSNRAFSFGQGCLVKLGDDTGGESFFSGLGFATFAPHLKAINEMLGRQWLITYRSNNSESGFRRLDVDSETGLKLYKPKGYYVK